MFFGKHLPADSNAEAREEDAAARANVVAMVMISHVSQVASQVVQRVADIAHGSAEVAQGAWADLPRARQAVDHIFDVMERAIQLPNVRP